MVKPLNFYDKNNTFILFSGSTIDSNDGFRHLNDLYFIMWSLVERKIQKEQIYLYADKRLINGLDEKTNHKSAIFNKKSGEFSAHIKNHTQGIYDPSTFEANIQQLKGQNLIFISSGHGSIDGIDCGNNRILSPDVFETFSKENRDRLSVLVLSQCISGAFNHLDTRNEITVLGSAEFQNSISQPIEMMNFLTDDFHNAVLENLCFYPQIPINPFIYTFVIYSTFCDQLINRKSKSLVEVYKYTATKTLQVLNDLHDIIPLTSTDGVNRIGFKLRQTQQPFLLNKILASDISFSMSV